MAAGLAAAALVVALGGGRAQAQGAAQAPAACARGAELSFVCGFQGSPEDLVQIAGTDWVLAGGLNAGDPAKPGGIDKPGGINLLDVRTKTQRSLPIANAGPRAPYTDCADPVKAVGFSAHGFNLKQEGPGRGTLFVVGHGVREAIEVFDVSWGSGEPKVAWIGCVRAAEGAVNNSVAPLKDGRIVATDFIHSTSSLNDLMAGKTTGAVYVWSPGGRFEKIPGTDLPGPNGIEVSPDQRWLFVAVSGTGETLRYDLRKLEKAPDRIRSGVRADNLRWAPDGRLLLAGQDITDCPQGFCPGSAIAVAAVDPSTLQSSRLATFQPTPEFSSTTAAIVVGDTLWLGAHSGDRAAYAKLK